jgi:hypothetical protein
VLNNNITYRSIALANSTENTEFIKFLGKVLENNFIAQSA